MYHGYDQIYKCRHHLYIHIANVPRARLVYNEAGGFSATFMNDYIKNFEKLATTKERRDALAIVSEGYRAIDTKTAIEKSVRIENDTLRIDGKKFNLLEYEKVYVLGCGKVACSAALSLEGLLKQYLDDGAVIGISKGVCEIVETFEGTHPLPSEVNFRASEKMKEIGEKAGENDLVLVIVGGGGSALLCGSMVEYKQGERLYRRFLETGGTIEELNTVRKHLSDLKGGGLAKLLYPATVVGLIFSDIPGDGHQNVASGPTYIDESSVDDAESIIDKYSLGEFDLIETPKNKKFFEKVHNVVLVSNRIALDAMKSKAESLRYRAIISGNDILSSPDETAEKIISASSVGSVVLAGGEVKLVVPEGCDGRGGRNDFMAMVMLPYIREGQVFVSFASDGHDNSDSAGAIIDYGTNTMLSDMKVDIDKYKVCLDSYTLFEESGNLLFTGDIEANVSDLMVLLTAHNTL